MRKIFCYLLVVLLSISQFSMGQNETKKLPAELEIPLKYGAQRLVKRSDKDMQRFRDNRLGLFIHWGLYAITGGEWEGKLYKATSEFLQMSADVSANEWMKLMNSWNPNKFDATLWAKTAKKLGAKYIKITTKHHDGFCLWPSKYSRYTVAQTPDKRDIIGELVEACRKEGVDVHLYYSILDWSHPDYRSAIKNEEDAVAFGRFLDFAENQLKELATRYPTVKDFWFDGTWDSSFKQMGGAWSLRIERMLKEMIPGVTVNSRLRADEYGKRHFDSNGHLMGDYESGYERRLPDPIKDVEKVIHHDWEAYMTIPENLWGYHKDWSWSYAKTPYEAIQRIVHAVSMGGNMVINFGPKPDGTFREEEMEMVKVVGDWMKKYGCCVYGCDYAGLEKQDWGYYTRGANNEIYMVVFNAPYSKKMSVKLPKDYMIEKAVVVDSKEEVQVKEIARDEYNVAMPKKTYYEPFVIQLKVKSKAGAVNKYQDALI